MSKRMSLMSRYEFLESIKKKYNEARGSTKTKILDGFIAATGYGRKHAIVLLKEKEKMPKQSRLTGRKAS